MEKVGSTVCWPGKRVAQSARDWRDENRAVSGDQGHLFQGLEAKRSRAMNWRVVRALTATVLLSLLPTLVLVNFLSPKERWSSISYFDVSESISEKKIGKGYDGPGNLLLDKQEVPLQNPSNPNDPSKSSVVQTEASRELPVQQTSVLLLSSTPRSGSSFVGELLATHSASVYFFEPIHKLQHTPCIESDECVSQYLKDKFQCRIDDAFTKWLKAKPLFLGFYNVETSKCAAKSEKKRVQCFKDLNITQACEDSQVRLVKVIRTRLSQVESLLSEESLNLKIIHLYRDPRGFMKSINKFKNWIKDPDYYCSGLSEDLRYSLSLQKRYPIKILQIPYEQISRNPTEYAELMFNFAFGSPTLPPETVQYIAAHTQKDEQDKSKLAMTRKKDSSKAYQTWRDNISSKLLVAVETNQNCRDSINLMKNRLFGDINSVRNKSISMFL